MNIIGSIGPKILSVESISELYHAGMTMVRFNCSHIDYKLYAQLINSLKKHHPGLKILVDLQGHKLRVGQAYPFQIRVQPGDAVIFCHEMVYDLIKQDYNETLIPIDWEGFIGDLLTTKAIIMKDATMKFEVVKHDHMTLTTRCMTGGVIRARKGLNARGMKRSHIALTDKDKHDIQWAASLPVDAICLSYAYAKEQVMYFQKQVAQVFTQNTPKLWAKIETPEGIYNLAEVAPLVDALMLGRGDLKSEVGQAKHKHFQQQFLKKSQLLKDIQIVVATGVLASMRYDKSPSLKEIQDIYNCLEIGVDGFMLGEEVGLGQHPVSVVRQLKSIVQAKTMME